MHDHGIGLEPGEPLLVQAKQGGVFPNTREQRLPLAFMLDSQQIHHVGIAEGLVNVMRDPTPKLLKHAGHKRGWTGKRDVGAELGQQPDIGTGNS